MKRLLAHSSGQAILAWMVVAYLEVVIRTLRWQTKDAGVAQSALDGPDGMVVLFWHGRIAQAIACRPLLGRKQRSVMVSMSRDGDFIAKAAEMLSFPTIRGSTGRMDATSDKGGAAALRKAIAVLRVGGVMLLTPDGPRGPRERIQVGAIHLARVARLPVFLLGLAARPSLNLRTWDGAQLPLPFAKAAIWVEGPESAPKITGHDALEETRLRWEAAMARAQSRAEYLLER